MLSVTCMYVCVCVCVRVCVRGGLRGGRGEGGVGGGGGGGGGGAMGMQGLGESRLPGVVFVYRAWSSVFRWGRVACPCQSCCHWRGKKNKNMEVIEKEKEWFECKTQGGNDYFSMITNTFLFPPMATKHPLPHSLWPRSSWTLHTNRTSQKCFSPPQTLNVFQCCRTCTVCQTMPVKTCVRNICFLLPSDKHMTSSIISPLPLQLSPLSRRNGADNFQHLILWKRWERRDCTICWFLREVCFVKKKEWNVSSWQI